MGLGLQNAYGLSNVREELKQRLLAQIAEQERARKGGLEERRMKLDEQESAQRAEIQKAMEEDRKAAQARLGQTADLGMAEKVQGSHAMGDIVSPNSAAIIRRGGLGDTLATQEPTLPARDILNRPTLDVRGQQVVSSPGNVEPQDYNIGNPKQREAQQVKILRGNLLSNPSLTPFQRVQMQAEEAGMKAPTAEPRESSQLYPIGPRGIMTPHDEAIGQPSYHPPRADPGEKLTKVEHRDENGRTVVEYLPQSEIRGKTFKKGVGATGESRLASAQAVNQTGADIIAHLNDPAFKATVGPAMGRASTLRDFIGNPPPEFAELAGSIESYALANMGVHGMRSAQGAEQIKKLLDQHHTPESLIATIQGLNKFSEHFMENEGRGKTGSGPNAPAPSTGTIRARDPQGRLREAPAGTPLPAGWKLEK